MAYTLMTAFLSNNCTADYLNSHLGIPHLFPTCVTTSDEAEFIRFVENFNDIDYSKRMFIDSKDAKVVKKGYRWDVINGRLGVNIGNTFGIKYGNKTNDETYEFYYRHYELNCENLNKIERRTQRFSRNEIMPFFIVHFTLETVCQTSSGQLITEAFNRLMSVKWTENYVFICPYSFKPETNYSGRHLLYSDLLHEPLMPVLKHHIETNFKGII